MLKYIIGGVAGIVILAGAYYFLVMGMPAPVQEATNQEQVPTATNPTYATSTYSISYPADYTVDANYAYDAFGPAKLIHGVKFTIPMTMATGTNLAPDTYLSVEQLPRAKNCTADIFLQQDVRAVNVTESGVAYSIASSSGVGAGNSYEERVLALTGSSPCTAVRYFIRSGTIASDPQSEAGAVREFDRDALISAFDTIRRTLQLAGASVSQTATTTATTSAPASVQP